MTSGLKAFGNYGVAARFGSFDCEFTAAHHMNNGDAVLLEQRRPGFGFPADVNTTGIFSSMMV